MKEADDDEARTTLYVARHGQSEWNNRSLITGQLDLALSPKGQQQSIALAQCLAQEGKRPRTSAGLVQSALARGGLWRIGRVMQRSSAAPS